MEGTNIQYYPFPGRIEGHPSVLAGSIDEIVNSAQTLAARDDVRGLDLLAHRSTENVTELMAVVCAAVDKLVIMAGSIGSKERIEIVRRSGAAGFSIGTAALDGNYPADSPELEHTTAIHPTRCCGCQQAYLFAQTQEPECIIFQVYGYVEPARCWSSQQHDDQIGQIRR